MTAHFSNETTQQERFSQREQLIKPFLKKYGAPIIVHSVPDLETFKKILLTKKLLLPSQHNSTKKSPYMEQVIGIHDALYYSLGFVYATAYNWPVSFIFRLSFLEELNYFDTSINGECYTKIANYWYDNDKEYLESFAQKNSLCKEVVQDFYSCEYEGKKRFMIKFWKVEEELMKHINAYHKKEELTKIILAAVEEHKKIYPESVIDAKNSFQEKRVPELIGEQTIDLLTNKHFLGFYTQEELPQEIIEQLQEFFPKKIFFDGENIQQINELLVTRE